MGGAETVLAGGCIRGISHRWVYQGYFSQVGVSGTVLTGGCIRDSSHRWVYQGQFSQAGVSGTETVLTGGCLIDSSQRCVHQERSYWWVYQEGFLAQVGVCKRFLELNVLGRGFTNHRWVVLRQFSQVGGAETVLTSGWS